MVETDVILRDSSFYFYFICHYSQNYKNLLQMVNRQRKKKQIDGEKT